jgi:hypothetical protein
MSDKRRDKRFKREHRKRSSTPSPAKVEVVYRPKTAEERNRRVERMDKLVGTPFLSLPNVGDRKATAFTASNGYQVTFEDVEMVYNDCLLMDAVSNWGEDGPLCYDTYDALHREVCDFAKKAYENANVEIPLQLRQPK